MRAFAAAFLFFLVLTAVVHRGLAWHVGDGIYVPPPADPAAGPPIGSFARGDQLLHVWALATNLRHLGGDDHPFSANSYWPMTRPLFHSDHLLGEALAVWPLRLFTAKPLTLHNLALLGSFVLSGAGTTLLLRSLGASTLAGLVAGVAWAFSPARSFEIFQLQLLTTQWIPFLALTIHRTLARPGPVPALAVAAFLALQLLSGVYVGTYVAVALMVFVPLLLATSSPPAPARSAGLLLLAGFAALAANAPWLAEYLRVRAALGEYGGLLENVAYSLSLQHHLLPTWAIDDRRFPGPLGATLGVLALGGAVARRGGPARLAYAGAALWTIACSLGPWIRWGASPESASGPGFLFRGPYAVLYALVPGLEALRVPARMSLVGGFFLAVLAGLGADALLGRLRARAARAAAAAGLAALLLVEARHVAPGIEQLPPPPPVYAWLRDAGREPMVEVPMNVLRDPLYLYYSTVHWRPLVNGYGAYLPTPYLYLQQLLDRFPAPDTVAALREIGVRHVVTHGLAPVSDSGVRLVAEFGDDRVYAVQPGPLPQPMRALRPLGRDGWQGHGEAGGPDAAAAYDADPRTAWSNVGDWTVAPLGAHGGSLGWLRTLRDWPSYERAYALRDRPQRFTLDLGRMVRPARVEMLLHVHQSPTFAPFALLASADGVAWTQVACPWRPAAGLLEFAARPAAIPLALECEFPPLRYLRLEQSPAAFRLYWELADVEVLLPADAP